MSVPASPHRKELLTQEKNQTQSRGCVYLIPETHQLFQNGGVFLQAARVEGHFQLVAGGGVARFLHAGEVAAKGLKQCPANVKGVNNPA